IILFDSSGIGFSTPLLYLLGAGLSVLSLLLLLRSKREVKPAFAPRRRRD
ncbi:MAG: LPXTG cell wall anchor domain-containing protein, partial [Xanthomonadaceae bacterium]|nr:LPXTG cell wall anchor domain-containing protein [Xanthomonadaceae bacterium]